MSTTNIELTTKFDRLPTEIIFDIFDYLSSNDIVYTFFFFSQRLNNLLLRNERYLTYLELPTTKFDVWKTILSIVGFRVECLNISTIDLSFPLKYFPNIKSIIISLPFGFPDEELNSILNSDQFNSLQTFKIKENQIFSHRFYRNYSTNQNDLLKNIFTNKNSLKIFQHPSVISSFSKKRVDCFLTNFNLHSLTLKLTDFRDIFTLICYTPNLEYLNVQSKPPPTYRESIKLTNIKLKQLYFKLDNNQVISDESINFDQLTNGVKQFSSSLNCLSLDLSCLNIKDPDQLPFNSIKLQQFLESLTELKQFHLYAQITVNQMSSSDILSRFENEYWFDHNWSFGMHENYFYTLPFHFDYLYRFYEGFRNVKSNNNDILTNNPRIWFNVKYIELLGTSKYNTDFINELKIKMPKLTFIKFIDQWVFPTSKIGNSCIVSNEREILDNVTIIQLTRQSIEHEKEWIIRVTPNLKHLILSIREFPSIDSQFISILNERIQRLDIDICFELEQLPEISCSYFSNVQYINCCCNDYWKKPQWYANIIMKILNNFKNLKSLIIYILLETFLANSEFGQLIECFDMNQISNNYHVKHFRQYYLFLRKPS